MSDETQEIQETQDEQRPPAAIENGELVALSAQLSEKEALLAALSAQLSEKDKLLADVSSKLTPLMEQTRALEVQATRLRVAYKTGLPLDVADRLRGDDEKAIEADAKVLLQFMVKQQGGVPNAPGTGAGITITPEQLNDAQFVRKNAQSIWKLAGAK